MFRVKNNKLVTHREEALFRGFLPVFPPDPLTPEEDTLVWLGAKIPAFWWNAMKRFLEKVYQLHGGEAQMRLFYNSTSKEWFAFPMPQYISAGLSTNEIEDDPDRSVWFGKILASGYSSMGTIHSHCDISAFQSGVDRADEHHQHGIHITLGHLGQPMWDCHWRVTFRGLEYDHKNVPITELIEGDLEAPDPKLAVPSTWMEMLKERPAVSYSFPGGSYQTDWVTDSEGFWYKPGRVRKSYSYTPPAVKDTKAPASKYAEDLEKAQARLRKKRLQIYCDLRKKHPQVTLNDLDPF